MSRVRRNRPAKAYRAISPARMIQESKRRAWPMRGPRLYEMVAVLAKLFPRAQSGIVFKGDSCGAGKHKSDHCCMAVLMKRCGKTAHRAKYDALRLGLIRLHGAGPRMCSCAGCGGDKAGGTILNSLGQPVSAATGYELDPSLLTQPKAGPRPPRKDERGLSSASNVESPAERRMREETQARMQATLATLRARPGP